MKKNKGKSQSRNQNQNQTQSENQKSNFFDLNVLAKIPYQYNARNLVYQLDKVKLYHYTAKIKNTDKIPLLIVFATVNRPEILEIFPEQSFIGGLLKKGLDVYLLDWGYPGLNDYHISMSDYINNYLYHCVQFIRNFSQQDKINLLGICQGGLLSLCYTIVFQTIRNLILISTPIDFHTKDNAIGHLLQQVDNKLLNLTENLPGLWLTQFFSSLRPWEQLRKKTQLMNHLYDAKWVEKFMKIEKWLYDAPDQTAASFSELIKDFYQQNKLIKGQIMLNGKSIDLASLTIPVLNVMAKEDEIIPVSASRVLKKYISSHDYTQKIFPSGHIGIYVSDHVKKNLPIAIANWLKPRNV